MNKIFKTLDDNYIEFEGNLIRIIIDNNEAIWINGPDLVKALGYSDIRKTLKRRADDDDKENMKNLNTDMRGHPETIYVNESGMYSLILSSRLQTAKTFKKWVTSEVLPSIRKYGMYKSVQKCEDRIINLETQINETTEAYEILKRDTKKSKYCEGSVLYIIDFSSENEEVYRIGITDNLNKRKQIYDTHVLHKREVVHITPTKCPHVLEKCLQSALYNYRQVDRRDFYLCSLDIIVEKIKKCKEVIGCDKGSDKNASACEFISNNLKSMKRSKKSQENKINKLTEKINK